VAYRETIRTPVDKVEAKFVRQTGGRGQYGHVVINVEPTDSGSGFVFENEIRGGAVPREYVPSVEQGIKEAMESGVIAGYPLIDVKATLIDGSMAFKDAVKRGDPVLLEPIMDVEVVTPDEYLGDVMGDLTSRRGKIGGMMQRSSAQVIGASVPLSEMFGYSTVLRSLSQGRAVYTMQFSHYDEVPKSKLEEILSSNGSN
jgi:elongation factor G